MSSALPAATAGAADLTESFDAWPASGWTIQNNSSPSGTNPTWFQGNPPSSGGPFESYNGAPNAYAAVNFNSTAGGTGTISNWFITPRISTLTQGDTISFYTRKYDVGQDYPDRLEVRLSTSATSCSPGMGATSVGDFTTLLVNINPGQVVGGYPRTWTRYEATVPPMPPGSGCFAFRYFVTGAGPTGSNSDYIGIDQVEIRDQADNVEPATAIETGPSGSTNEPDASFTYAATPSAGVGSYECRLTLGDATPSAFAECPSAGRTYDDLADGAYTFEVRGVSHGGNVDPTPATRSFTVDTTAPETAITSGPSGAVATADVTFGYEGTPADDVAGFECRLITADDADPAFASCLDAGQEHSALADGDYTFEVRAKDAVGNTDATPAARSFTVDTAAPDTAITDGPSGTVATDEVTFTYEGTPTADTDRFECRLRTTEDDDPDFADCPAAGSTVSDPADGDYVFEVRAVDAVGNVDGSPAERAFSVDRTAPEVAIASGPAATGTATTAVFAYAATPTEDVDAVECRLVRPDDADPAFGACADAAATYEGLAAGAYRFELRARDAVGNVSAVADWPFVVEAPPSEPPPGPTGGDASVTPTPPTVPFVPPARDPGVPIAPPGPPAHPPIKGLRLERTTFRAATSGPAFGPTGASTLPGGRGTWLRFELDRAVRIELRISRSIRRRWHPLRGVVTRTASPGVVRVPFRGRFRGVTLKSGRYRLSVTLTDPVTGAKATSLRQFRIRR